MPTAARGPVARHGRETGRLAGSERARLLQDYRSGANATKKGRRFFMGATHRGFVLEAHETALGPGVETHAPHRHLHEEIIIVVEGTLEVERDGTTSRVEAGSGDA